MIKFTILLFLLLGNVYAAAKNDPRLSIETPNTTSIITRSQLLKRNKISYITMQNSRAYLGIKMNYTAVKFCDLLKPFNVNDNDTVELIAYDGFDALVPAKFLTKCNNQSAIAYLAIETEKSPWPILKYNNPNQLNIKTPSAGPFQVIWLNPEKSYISNEYWAWKLIKIKIHHTLDKKIFLSAPTTSNKHIQNGYQAYVSRCLACHTINHMGKGVIGPDLNTPISAIDKFDNDYFLKKFIRDPQSVRAKKNDRMSGTNEHFLSNKDLNDLILYLRYMSKYKKIA